MKFFIALASLTLVNINFQKPASFKQEDSLYQAYKSARYPKDKMPILRKLGKLTLDYDLKKSLEFTESYLKICEEFGTDQDKADAYWMMAWVTGSLENDNVALEYYLKAKTYYLRQGEESTIANIYNNIGTIFMNAKKFEKARSYFFQSIKINQRFNDLSKLTRNYFNLTLCEMRDKNYDQSLIYLDKATEYANELSSSERVNDLINLKGIIYYYQENYSTARKYYFQAIIHIDSAENKARRLGMAYNNIGETYREEGDYQKASEYFEKAMVFKKQYANPESVASTLINISKLALLQNQPETAIAFLEETFNILDNDRMYPKLKEASELLVEAYKNKKHFSPEDFNKILNLNKEYIDYIDELKLEKDQKVTTLIVDHGEIKEEAQYLQKKEKSIQKRSLWIIVSASVVVLGLLILLYYREKRFKNFIKQMWEDIRDV